MSAFSSTSSSNRNSPGSQAQSQGQGASQTPPQPSLRSFVRSPSPASASAFFSSSLSSSSTVSLSSPGVTANSVSSGTALSSNASESAPLLAPPSITNGNLLRSPSPSTVNLSRPLSPANTSTSPIFDNESAAGMASPLVKLAPSPGSASFTTPANRRLVIIYSTLLLITSVMNAIYFKRMIDSMPNYVYFINQFTSLLYIPIFWSLVFYELLFTRYITKDMRAFPKWKFAFMGLFDAVSGLIGLFGAVHTSGSVQALLTNAVIPVTMWLSVLVLKAKYSLLEYAGSAIIMLGIAVVMVPTIYASIFSSGPGSSHGQTSDSLLFNLLFLSSVIPAALSSIYKEIAFVDTDMDVNFMNAWVANWQILYGFALVPLNSMPFLGAQYVPLNQLWTAFVDGWLCFLGNNNVVPPHCILKEDLINGYDNADQLPVCDECQHAWIPLLLYMFFNTLFNTFTVLLVKYGGSTLMFIIMTLRLPVVQVAFSLSFVQNPPDPISVQTLISLAFILSGLAVYKWPVKSNEELVSQHLPVIPPILGAGTHATSMAAVRHEKLKFLYHVRRTDPRVIRSTFYSKLGLIPSPATSVSRQRALLMNKNNTPNASARTHTSMIASNNPATNTNINNNENSSTNGSNRLRSSTSLSSLNNLMTAGVKNPSLPSYGALLRSDTDDNDNEVQGEQNNLSRNNTGAK